MGKGLCALLSALLCMALLLTGCGGSDAEPEEEPEEESAQAFQQDTLESAGPFDPDLTARMPVDDTYFLDAVFFGNSLMDGVRQFGGLRYGSFITATSAAVYNIDSSASTQLSSGETGTLYEALTEFQRGKIYILLGINEIGYEKGFFIEEYSTLLERLREDEPATVLYICSMTPVTQEKSVSHELFNMERIGEYNAALHDLAVEKGCYYVDLVDALAGEDGYLPAELASDDVIHPKADKYALIADYLRTHYAGEYQIAAPQNVSDAE